LDLWLYGVHMNVLTTERRQYTPFFKFKSSHVNSSVSPDCFVRQNGGWWSMIGQIKSSTRMVN